MKWKNEMIIDNICCSLNCIQWSIISRRGIQTLMNYILVKCYDVPVKRLKQQQVNCNLDSFSDCLVRRKRGEIRWDVLSV